MALPKGFDKVEDFHAVLVERFGGKTTEEIERFLIHMTNPGARANLCAYFDFVEPVSTSLIAKSIYKDIHDTGNG